MIFLGGGGLLQLHAVTEVTHATPIKNLTSNKIPFKWNHIYQT